MMSRRTVIGGLTAGAAIVVGGTFVRSAMRRNLDSWDTAGSLGSEQQQMSGGMNYRVFGKSGVRVSEVGFGAWGIGGAYGAVDRTKSLGALARAEELGCNFVDTAMGYGDSELVLGEFLRGRRDKWLVATKYSNQPAGLEATLNEQLNRLGVSYVDLYQLHWAPRRNEWSVYEDLYRVKKTGKARLIGVSLYSLTDIDFVLNHADVDVIQLAFSLLDPDPFIGGLDRIRKAQVGVIVRSTLKEGFLTGKYRRDATFPDPNDQRHGWSADKIAATVDAAESFRFVEQDAGSMAVGAACYPLSFDATSTVILGTKSAAQAEMNFGVVPTKRLSQKSLARVQELQQSMRLFNWRGRIRDQLRRLLG